MDLKGQEGYTLIELVVTACIIVILASIGIPQISEFNSRYEVRSAGTDLMQNMRLSKAMAIKDNRPYIMVFDTGFDGNNDGVPDGRYMFGFDGNNDGDLKDLNIDGFGSCGCVDMDNDGVIDIDDNTGNDERVPLNDGDNDGDFIPDCIRQIRLIDYDTTLQFGTPAVLATDNATALGCNGGTACFGNTNPIRETFNPDGSFNLIGSVYFQKTGLDPSFAVVVGNRAGQMTLFSFHDTDNDGQSEWEELR